MLPRGDKYFQSIFKKLEAMKKRADISQDKEKQLQYTARQKALYDYNTLIEEQEAKGRAKERAEIIAKLKARGKSDEEINALLN